MTDGTFRMLDKIENEFEFNGAGLLTGMKFSDIHQIRLDYQKAFAAKLDRPPFKIEKASKKWVKVKTIRIPEKLLIKSLTNDKSEIFVYTKKGGVVGYMPLNTENSSFEFLALMSDLSYRLLDKKNNELLFNQSGEFQKVITTSKKYIVKSISSGNYKIKLGYSPTKKGCPIITQAVLLKEGGGNMPIILSYKYDKGGRLAKVMPIRGKKNCLSMASKE